MDRLQLALGAVWTGIKAILAFLRDYGDLVVAGGVVVWAAINDPKGDDLTRTTGVLIGVLAFVLARERWTRKKGFSLFESKLESLDDKASEVETAATKIGDATRATEAAANETKSVVSDALGVLAGEKPYQALRTVFTDEILTADGAKATARTVRDLRFTANNVYSIYEFFKSSGPSTPLVCKGKRPGGPEKDLPIMHEGFPGPGDKRFRIISLEDFLDRGDRMEIETVRQLENSFVDSRESVKIEITTVADEVGIEIIWAAGYDLLTVEMQRTGSTKWKQPLPVSGLVALGDGRRKLVYPVENPVVDDEVFIIWTWKRGDDATSTTAERRLKDLRRVVE